MGYLENPAQQLRVVWDVARVIFEMFKQRKEVIHNVQVQRKGFVKIAFSSLSDEQRDRFLKRKKVKRNEKEIGDVFRCLNCDLINDHCGNMNAHCRICPAVQKKEENDIKEEDKQKNEKIDSDGQRYTKLIDIDGTLGPILKLLVDYKVTDWEHNLFTRGSYSYLPKGAVYSHCKELQKYDGNGVYLCGEATSVDGFECVDGAHETGFNVAKQIHKELQKQQQNSM